MCVANECFRKASSMGQPRQRPALSRSQSAAWRGRDRRVVSLRCSVASVAASRHRRHKQYLVILNGCCWPAASNRWQQALRHLAFLPERPRYWSVSCTLSLRIWLGSSLAPKGPSGFTARRSCFSALLSCRFLPSSSMFRGASPLLPVHKKTNQSFEADGFAAAQFQR